MQHADPIPQTGGPAGLTATDQVPDQVPDRVPDLGGNPAHASNHPGPSAGQHVKLKPRHGWQAIDLAELWHYRELIWILTLRDIKVRYKQTALGALWAIIQPLMMTAVSTILFARLGNLPTDGVPAPLFYFCGNIVWQLFSISLTGAGNSLIGNQNLITKVYFPRLAIPISAVMTGLIDFAIAFGLLLLMMAWYHHPLSLAILLMPVFVLMIFLAALGAGLWLSALNVEFRDVRYVIPFLTQFWYFITPIVYPSSLAKAQWMRNIMGINPLSGPVEGFRWCMLGKPAPNPMLLVSFITILLVLIGGLFYFRRMEKSFADLV